MTPFLRVGGVDSSNNAVERMNRVFVCIRGDGGVNRSPEGMRDMSVLLTVLATCKVQGKQFFGHVLASLNSGYG